MFGLVLFTLIILIAYVGSSPLGLGPVGWRFVLAGAIHLVCGTRRGEPLTGMRDTVRFAALPVAQVTQAFVTTPVRFGAQQRSFSSSSCVARGAAGGRSH